jgi:hypothetical protein
VLKARTTGRGGRLNTTDNLISGGHRINLLNCSINKPGIRRPNVLIRPFKSFLFVCSLGCKNQGWVKIQIERKKINLKLHFYHEKIRYPKNLASSAQVLRKKKNLHEKFPRGQFFCTTRHFPEWRRPWRKINCEK